MRCKFCQYDWSPRKHPSLVKACPKCKLRFDYTIRTKKEAVKDENNQSTEVWQDVAISEDTQTIPEEGDIRSTSSNVADKEH